MSKSEITPKISPASPADDMLALAQRTEHALSDIRAELLGLGLWNEDEAQIPTDADLNSKIPFCLDTMPFERWLQYVLLPRLELMARESPEALRDLKLSVHPAAEEYWRGEWGRVRKLLLALRRLDAIFG